MIEKLKWDSAFFGFPVGKTSIESPDFFNEGAFLNAASAYKLVYLFAKSPISNSRFTQPADVKLTFQKTLESENSGVKLRVFNADFHDYNDLQMLAFQSGEYSRFKTDKGFDPKEFNRMYDIWIKKSIDSERSMVLVEELDNKLAGFVSIDFDESETVSIGLIAVDGEMRGKGVGALLMAQAEKAALKVGKKFIRVATQQKNTSATNFYVKQGYSLADQIFIYHYWNL